MAKSGDKGASAMTHDTMDYEGIMRRAGYRVTSQRVLILDAVCAGEGHTTLKQIYTRLHRMDATIDRSSVYRTLKLFVVLGLVVSAKTPDGETVYEIPKPHRHHHLVCRVCGQEQEIRDDVLTGTVEAVRRQHRFVVEADHLVLHGICNACKCDPEE